MKMPIYLSQPAVSSVLGDGLFNHINQLLKLNPPEISPLTPSSQWIVGKTRFFGAISTPLRDFPEDLSPYHRSRNNQLLWHCLVQIEDKIQLVKQKYGKNRVAVVLGTSTSGVDENIPVFQKHIQGEAWQNLAFSETQHLMVEPADFVADYYGLHHARYVVSTACTSGARALISAARLLRAGVCDAVICGGVDTLSPLTINGFESLEVLSDGIAKPFSANRDGINIGEAAAVFVMTREALDDSEHLFLLGHGSSSDAYHMSSPRADGLGAVLAFESALKSAQLLPSQIGWINVHGTGTAQNDAMESQAIYQVFGENTPCTSTKPLTGHTLGAAGALEAALAWGVASRQLNPEGRLPAHLWDEVYDKTLPNIYLTHAQSHWQTAQRIVASSSFAFGGNNSVLMIGEAS